jgi:hypothetical protein
MVPYIGDSDLYGSRGDRLRERLQINRQFWLRDRPVGQAVLNPVNREELEAKVRNGSSSAEAARMIVMSNFRSDAVAFDDGQFHSAFSFSIEAWHMPHSWC